MKIVKKLLVIALVSINALAVYGQSTRPNIIFLFADDQRADAIGASGNSFIHTPNMDRLAKEGFYFKNNYCAGSFSGAVCVASRAMLMTGMHWTKMKSKGGMDNCVFLPEFLSENGYQTFIVGKWHNGEKTLERAFQTGEAVFMGGMNKHTEVPLFDLSEGKLVNERIDSSSFSSKIFADVAINYLEKVSPKKPFFLYVAFSTPHDPRNAPESYRKEYYKNPPPLPENFFPLHPFDNGFLFGRDECLAPWPRPRDMIQDQLSEYYALTTFLDEQVGRIYEALKNSPNADNTYIIYTADHGLALGSHGLLGKQNVYEQSMKSPLIIYGPDVPAGKSTEAFSYIFDLYATCLHLAGVQVPKQIDSKDLSAIWTNKKLKVREAVFLPFQEKMRTVNDGRWKLHIYPPSNHVLLFDLKNDPQEIVNMANNPEYGDTIKRLTNLLKDWQVRENDETSLFVEHPVTFEADFSLDKFSDENRILDPLQPKWIREKYFKNHK